MDLYVEGESVEIGQARTPYRGWVVANAYSDEYGEFGLYESAKSMRAVLASSVNRYRLAPGAEGAA
jgi:hypothetical protein